MALLNGLDAIVFTGGIGENSILLREMVCSDLEAMGIYIDLEKNNRASSEEGIFEFHVDDSEISLLIVPTDEEMEIAIQSYTLLHSE